MKVRIDDIKQLLQPAVMKLEHFDLNLLVALDALLQTRSVRRASDRLHIGPSATSSALGRLRDFFNDEILMQVGRRMEPTPLGLSLEGPVRDALLSIQSLVHTKLNFDPKKAQRRFLIRASDYMTTVLFTRVVQRLQLEAPGICLDIVALTDDVAERLERGELDLVIYPLGFVNKRRPFELLFEESFICVVWADNAEIGLSISTAQYQNLGHVVATFDDRGTTTIVGTAKEAGQIARNVEITTTNFNTLPQLVIGTTRIATVQLRLAQIYARHFPLKLLSPPIPLPKLEFAMQWHDIATLDPAHVWLRNVILQEAGADLKKRPGSALD